MQPGCVHYLNVGGRELNQWLEKLTEAVALAQDERGVKSALQRIATKAGFSAYAYLSLQAEMPKAISNYADEWQQRYFELRYSTIDPVVRDAHGRMEAFAWSNRTTPKMTRARRTFCGEAAEFGIRSGISVPIRTGFGRWAMLTLASDDVDFAERQSINPVAAAAAVGQVHSRLEFIRVRPTRHQPVPLKADELACLRWSAEGKSMRAIAIIENTSYANVAFFIRNAKAALGVSTLPQATAMAKELGLI
jgi:LuxR family transcriptional activator of conjugal transfer of Ti plasmids